MTAAAGPRDGQDPRAERGDAAYRRALVALFCAGLATFAQMYSPQGLLPEIAREFGIDAGASSWAVGATTIGVAAGVLPWARVSDRYGRVRTMRWAIAAAMLLGLAVPFAPGFAAMIGLRVVEGVALAGVPALAVTALAETVRPHALGAAVGTYVAGTTLGGLAGRLLAGAVEEPAGWRAGMVVVAVVAALAAAGFAILVPRPAVPQPAGSPILGAIAANLRNPAVLVLVALAFLLMGGFVAAYNALAFRLELPPYSLSLMQVSWLFLAYLAGTLTSGTVWGLVRRRRATTVLLGCLGVMAAGLALTLGTGLAAIVVGLVLFTGGFFGAHSIANGLVGRRAAGLPGASQAPPLYNLGYYAGSSLLGWAGTAAFAAWGWGGASAMIAAAIALAAILVVVSARRHPDPVG
ncbi:MFS transporter [Leucobacter allii]|uniref:MFS transporter n=1 Tax=Leucobacter allii TaxID=2932247 RepID=UPI001FD0D5C3|nr:MFS transporter [Leucobacter allii]UOR02222.1 MFS transporter [Leucobacter allii]